MFLTWVQNQSSDKNWTDSRAFSISSHGIYFLSDEILKTSHKISFLWEEICKKRTFSDEKKGRMNGFIINTCKHEGHATKVVSLCNSPTLWESSPFQQGFQRSKNRVKWRDGKYKQWLNTNRSLLRYPLHIHGTTRLTLTEHSSCHSQNNPFRNSHFPTTTAHCCRESTAVRCMTLYTLRREVAMDVLPLGEDSYWFSERWRSNWLRIWRNKTLPWLRKAKRGIVTPITIAIMVRVQVIQL